MKIDKNIFLIGFMGVGKSTIGRALQQRLQLPLIEMDERIVQEQGMSINEIFDRYGEERFRELESALVAELCRRGPAVVSCGGGTAVRPQNVEAMRAGGAVVFLTAEPQTVYERVKSSTERPILNGHMDVEYIAGLMEKRRAYYEAAADIRVVTDGRTGDEICDEILERMTGGDEDEI